MENRISSPISEILDRLNEQQRKAVKDIYGPKFVVACPGAGKTASIIARTQYMILNGINPENTTFNGKLYLTDPSKYRILDIGSTEELEKLNNYQFYILLTNLIIKELNKSHISASTIQRMKELLSLKDDSIYYSDYLEEILEDNSSIKTLIKKI